MRMKKTKTLVERFRRGDYYIDIYVYGDYYCEAFLVRRDCGTSSLMFGEYDADYDEFCERVDANLDEYIKVYEERYCQ